MYIIDILTIYGKTDHYNYLFKFRLSARQLWAQLLILRFTQDRVGVVFIVYLTGYPSLPAWALLVKING